MPYTNEADRRAGAASSVGRWDVVCVGLATWDTIVPVDAWPERDGRQVVGSLVRAPGGPAATAAVAAASLGARTAFVGAVGDDAEAEWVGTALEACGVAVDLVPVAGRTTPQSVILVAGPDGSRSILHARGAERRALGAAVGLVADATWVHVDAVGYPLVRRAVEPSRISVDAGNPVDGLDLEGIGCFGPTPAALAGRYPGASVPAAIRAALDEGAHRVVVTLGADGAVAADSSGAWRIPAVEVDVRSTLGAGDVFHGALVAGLALGAPLSEAAARANLVAALSCRAMDGRSAIPTRAELRERALPAVEPIELPDRP